MSFSLIVYNDVTRHSPLSHACPNERTQTLHNKVDRPRLLQRLLKTLPTLLLSLHRRSHNSCVVRNYMTSRIELSLAIKIKATLAGPREEVVSTFL